MADTETLVLPIGADTGQISHGTVTYRPYFENPDDPHSRILVKVPTEVAQHMVGVGGFQMADDLMPPVADEREKAPFVLMFHPDHGSCDAYPRDKKGFYRVPNGPAVAVMRTHGFLVEGDEPAADPVEETVPVAVHEAALARIAEFAQKIKSHEIDTKLLRDQLDVAEGKVKELTASLTEARKARKPAVAPATPPAPPSEGSTGGAPAADAAKGETA